ncbi:MAG TPA: hypothetical protein VE225_05280, partial [Rubrobacteraceae bacterium]|nr:hypothetical protein [Rubrobacteraceae bacterium]
WRLYRKSNPDNRDSDAVGLSDFEAALLGLVTSTVELIEKAKERANLEDLARLKELEARIESRSAA